LQSEAIILAIAGLALRDKLGDLSLGTGWKVGSQGSIVEFAVKMACSLGISIILESAMNRRSVSQELGRVFIGLF
jgi:hypothetical protein